MPVINLIFYQSQRSVRAIVFTLVFSNPRKVSINTRWTFCINWGHRHYEHEGYNINNAFDVLNTLPPTDHGHRNIKWNTVWYVKVQLRITKHKLMTIQITCSFASQAQLWLFLVQPCEWPSPRPGLGINIHRLASSCLNSNQKFWKSGTYSSICCLKPDHCYSIS